MARLQATILLTLSTPSLEHQHNQPDDLWIIVDSKVFDLTKFVNLHPGGKAVLIDTSVAGKDATEAFFSLHRHEVLLTPRYARLQIGVVQGQTAQITPPQPGEISNVPYAEPTWLSEGFKSPYYKESHWRLQKVMREFVDIHLKEEALVNEETGKRPSMTVIQKAA